VYEVSYRQLRYQYFKHQDSWTERFFIQLFSLPLAYLILKLNQSKGLPYTVTALSFFANLVGAGLIYLGHYRTGGILWFSAFVLDNTDGTLSRFIYGEDPETRGTLDFTLDNVALFPILLALFSVILRYGTMYELIWFFLYVVLIIVLFSEWCTRQRLHRRLIEGAVSPSSRERTKEYFDRKSRVFHLLTNTRVRINDIAVKYRTVPLPTMPDVHVLVYI